MDNRTIKIGRIMCIVLKAKYLKAVKIIKYTSFIKKSILIIFISFFFSCQNIPKGVEDALKLSGNNRAELEKVINHYQNPKDTLKLKAAYFLIQNMSNKYSTVGGELEKLNVIFASIEKARKKKLIVRDIYSEKNLVVDSLWDVVSTEKDLLKSSYLTVELDLNSITSTFLIENIEYSFKAWDLPWSNHLSFEEFCEYILPYRISDETLISWRPLIYRRYKPLIDSLKVLNLKDPVKICKIVNKKLLGKWVYSATLCRYPVGMTADNLMKAYMGSCKNQAALAVFTMRALGVPVTYEQAPHYGNRSIGHAFNGVLCKNGKFVDFEAGENEGFGHLFFDSQKADENIPKIFRETCSLSNKSLVILKQQSEEIPSFFMNPSIIDVTSKYLPTSNINLKITLQAPKNCSYVYLCVFDNKNWQAVGWSKVIDNHAFFENMGRRIVYMPMYYTNGKFVPASSPIILDKMGTIDNIVSVEREQKMILKRKYKPCREMQSLMINTAFQGSNTIDFKKTIDLYSIKDSVELIQKNILLKSHGKYRYVRYLVSATRRGDISEISFLDKKGIPLTGEIISSKNTSQFTLDNNKNVKNTTIINAFDNDILSFAVMPENSTEQWIGLDFGKKKHISKLSFCPKTDKNDVWPELNYELFYWDKGWKSLGQKKAFTNTLTYKSPVSNALFLLRCLDEGDEERIFTYRNGKQIWW